VPGSKSIPYQVGRGEISILRSNSSTRDGIEDVHERKRLSLYEKQPFPMRYKPSDLLHTTLYIGTTYKNQ